MQKQVRVLAALLTNAACVILIWAGYLYTVQSHYNAIMLYFGSIEMDHVIVEQCYIKEQFCKGIIGK